MTGDARWHSGTALSWSDTATQHPAVARPQPTADRDSSFQSWLCCDTPTQALRSDHSVKLLRQHTSQFWLTIDRIRTCLTSLQRASKVSNTAREFAKIAPLQVGGGGSTAHQHCELETFPESVETRKKKDWGFSKLIQNFKKKTILKIGLQIYSTKRLITFLFCAETLAVA